MGYCLLCSVVLAFLIWSTLSACNTHWARLQRLAATAQWSLAWNFHCRSPLPDGGKLQVILHHCKVTLLPTTARDLVSMYPLESTSKRNTTHAQVPLNLKGMGNVDIKPQRPRSASTRENAYKLWSAGAARPRCKSSVSTASSDAKYVTARIASNALTTTLQLQVLAEKVGSQLSYNPPKNRGHVKIQTHSYRCGLSAQVQLIARR